MGWEQKIEYVDVEVTLPPPVKKQVWNGTEFVPMTLYRHKGLLDKDEEAWIKKTFGPAGVYKDGQYWDYTRSGAYTIMDGKVYTWFQMKWGSK